MIYLSLFLLFFQLGIVSFGGGYGMLALVRETIVERGWMTDGELLNFLAASESTPGPIAVNLATFIGSSQGGILGSAVATLGIVLPSFIIILIIAAVLSNLMKYRGVSAFLSGLRPCVVAMILSTAITLFLSTLLSFENIKSAICADYFGFIILAVLLAVHFIAVKLLRKSVSPIFMILLSAGLGMIFYS
jgi:chromate transporter